MSEVKPATGTAIVTGTKVALREGPSTSAKVITRIDTGNTVRLAEVPDEWTCVSYDGKTGFMMTQFLNKGGNG